MSRMGITGCPALRRLSGPRTSRSGFRRGTTWWCCRERRSQRRQANAANTCYRWWRRFAGGCLYRRDLGHRAAHRSAVPWIDRTCPGGRPRRGIGVADRRDLCRIPCGRPSRVRPSARDMAQGVGTGQPVSLGLAFPWASRGLDLDCRGYVERTRGKRASPYSLYPASLRLCCGSGRRCGGFLVRALRRTRRC